MSRVSTLERFLHKVDTVVRIDHFDSDVSRLGEDRLRGLWIRMPTTDRPVPSTLASDDLYHAVRELDTLRITPQPEQGLHLDAALSVVQWRNLWRYVEVAGPGLVKLHVRVTSSGSNAFRAAVPDLVRALGVCGPSLRWLSLGRRTPSTAVLPVVGRISQRRRLAHLCLGLNPDAVCAMADAQVFPEADHLRLCINGPFAGPDSDEASRRSEWFWDSVVSSGVTRTLLVEVATEVSEASDRYLGPVVRFKDSRAASRDRTVFYKPGGSINTRWGFLFAGVGELRVALDLVCNFRYPESSLELELFLNIVCDHRSLAPPGRIEIEIFRSIATGPGPSSRSELLMFQRAMEIASRYPAVRFTLHQSVDTVPSASNVAVVAFESSVYWRWGKAATIMFNTRR